MEFKPYEMILLLLATIGPLKVTIVCATLTAGAPRGYIQQVAGRSVLIALIVCIVFALLGEVILKIFQVQLPAFQVGGGIVVMLFSLDMAVRDRPDDKNALGAPATPSLEIATYPLAVPLMASVSGLVAIVSLMAQSDHDPRSLLFLSAVIAAIMALNYVCLLSSRWIVRALGPATLKVIEKIMGVILVALAVELIHMGLIGLGVIPKAG